jgi:hypothetical protein
MTMKLIGVTGLTCKTSTVHTIDQALVDQGFSTFAFTTFYDFHNRNKVGGPYITRTSPMPDDVAKFRNIMAECDYVLMEVTPAFVHDDRLQKLFGPLDISAMTVYGDPSAGYVYASRQQYFHYKNMIFGSCLKRDGTAILQRQDDPAVEQAYLFAQKRGVKIVWVDAPFDHVKTANAVLKSLGLPETAIKVDVPGRQEIVRERLIVDKCDEEPAYPFCNKWIQSLYPKREVVVAVSLSGRMPDEPHKKKMKHILAFDGIKNIYVYMAHTNKKIKFNDPKVIRTESREDAFAHGLKAWKKGAVLILMGNGDQVLWGRTDREVIESMLNETP